MAAGCSLPCLAMAPLKPVSKKMALPMPTADDDSGASSSNKRARLSQDKEPLDPLDQAIDTALAAVVDDWPSCEQTVPPSEQAWLRDLPDPGISWFFCEALHIDCSRDKFLDPDDDLLVGPN